MKALSEEKDRETIDAWYERANKVRTPEELGAFVQELVGEYRHDYGTVVHACAAAAVAAGHAVSGSNAGGGITGFQAGCVMWSFLSKWLHEDGPMRLVKYEEMLYPQYEESFQKTITTETATWLREQAQKKLAEFPEVGHSQVRSHLERVAEGHVPFGYTVRDR